MLAKLDPRTWHAGAMNLVYTSNQLPKWGGVARPAANLLATGTSISALAMQALIWSKDTVCAARYIPGRLFGRNLEQLKPFIKSSNKLGNYAKSFFISLLATPLSTLSKGISNYNTHFQHRQKLFVNVEVVQKLEALGTALKNVKESLFDISQDWYRLLHTNSDFYSRGLTNEKFEDERNRLSIGSKTIDEKYVNLGKTIGHTIQTVDPGFLSNKQKIKIAKLETKFSVAFKDIEANRTVANQFIKSLDQHQNAFNNRQSCAIVEKQKAWEKDWVSLLGPFASAVHQAYVARHTNIQLCLNNLANHDSVSRKIQELKGLQQEYLVLDFSRNPESPYKQEVETNLKRIEDVLERFAPLCEAIKTMRNIARGTPNKGGLLKSAPYLEAIAAFEKACEHPGLQLNK